MEICRLKGVDMGEDLEKFIERYPTYIEALEMLEQKDQQIAELEKELAGYKELQDQLGLKNVDEFEWFVMLDLLTDNEKNMHILDLHRELAELKEKAIVPKFKIGQEVWYISQNNDNVYEFMIKEMVFTRCKDGREMIVYYDEYCAQMYEYELYSSKEEAQAKLQELRGEE